MSNCEYDQYLVDFVSNELAPQQHYRVQDHIRTCAACSKNLCELNALTFQFKSYKREQPLTLWLEAYESRLRKHFVKPRTSHSFTLTIKKGICFLHALRFRLAIGVALLLLGFSLGYYATLGKSHQIILKPRIIVMPEVVMSSNELSKYITDSEMILLSVTNFRDIKNVEFHDLLVYKIASSKLVSQTKRMSNYTSLLRDDNLLVLTRIEEMLSEIADIRENNYQQILINIRNVVNDKDLLRGVKDIKDEMPYIISRHI